MSKTIIATLYSYQPVIASVMRIGADNLFLLVDYNPDQNQKKAIEEVNNAIGKIVKIKIIKSDIYDIVKVVKEVTEVIDNLSPEEKIILNVSAGRKTKSLGLLYAGYIRANKIDKIIYVTKEDNNFIQLPKLSFNISLSQKKILEFLNGDTSDFNFIELKNYVGKSRATIYKLINDLKVRGMIETTNGLRITDAGRVAIL